MPATDRPTNLPTETPTNPPTDTLTNPPTEPPTTRAACDYAQFSAEHSMLLPPNPECNAHMNGVSEAEKLEILEAHNTLRAKVRHFLIPLSLFMDRNLISSVYYACFIFIYFIRLCFIPC